MGRVLFNSILPRQLRGGAGLPRTTLMKKKDALGAGVESYRRAGLADTVQFLDRLKEFGFRYATMGGVSIGVEDLEIPAEKATLLRRGREAGASGSSGPTTPARSPSASATTR